MFIDQSKHRKTSRLVSRWQRVPAGIALCLSVAGTSAATAGESRLIRLVTGNDFAPFSDEGLPSGGLATELVARIFGDAGYKVDIDFLPWKRGYRSTLVGKYDGTFPYYKTADRMREFIFSDPLLKTQGRVYVAKNSRFEANSIADFTGMKLCRALGYSIPSLFLPLTRAGKIEVVKVSKPHNSMRMVDKKRCDFVIWNKHIATNVLHAVKDKKIRLRPIKFRWAPSTTHFIVAQDHPEADKLIRAFNRGLNKLRDNGIYSKIVETHLTQQGL